MTVNKVANVDQTSKLILWSSTVGIDWVRWNSLRVSIGSLSWVLRRIAGHLRIARGQRVTAPRVRMAREGGRREALRLLLQTGLLGGRTRQGLRDTRHSREQRRPGDWA